MIIFLNLLIVSRLRHSSRLAQPRITAVDRLWSHEPKQMHELLQCIFPYNSNFSPKFEFDSAHVKYGVWSLRSSFLDYNYITFFFLVVLLQQFVLFQKQFICTNAGILQKCGGFPGVDRGFFTNPFTTSPGQESPNHFKNGEKCRARLVAHINTALWLTRKEVIL